MMQSFGGAPTGAYFTGTERADNISKCETED
jgi:hypothetical protein